MVRVVGAVKPGMKLVSCRRLRKRGVSTIKYDPLVIVVVTLPV